MNDCSVYQDVSDLIALIEHLGSVSIRIIGSPLDLSIVLELSLDDLRCSDV
jgi:hypothetical protein